jgi:hypothetical protein
VPPSTDARIEALCEKIRTLCRGPLGPDDEANLRKLAEELRLTIKDHVRLAKSSLIAKQAAINARNPDDYPEDSAGK